MDSFKQQYLSPQWQKKRLEVLNEKGFQCEICGDEETTIHVHHKIYKKGHMIWEYENNGFLVLCEVCHLNLHHEFGLIKTYASEINPENYFDIARMLFLLQNLNPYEIKQVIDLACDKAGEYQ